MPVPRLPASLGIPVNHQLLTDAVSELVDPRTELSSVRDMGGGSFGPTAQLTLTDGRELFAKFFPAGEADRARAEQEGLQTLSRAGAPRVPTVVGIFPKPDNAPSGAAGNPGPCVLLMSYHPQRNRTAQAARRLGSELAELHRSLRADRSGFRSDNYIGATPQSNVGVAPGPHEWQRFFAERRLLALARALAERDSRHRTLLESVEDLCLRLPDLLPDPDAGRPSLIHGDLWGGNVLSTDDGAMLIDPAVSFGHREADLAMTELFGGFPPFFLDAYREAWPLEPGYRDRIPLYNLYHLLNHVLLFGDSWLSGVQGTLRRFSG